MRRKRLQHHADNLCQMFCGWQLMFDWRVLTRLRSGTIILDLLTGECRYNGEAIPALSMASVLGGWLRDDAAANAIPLSEVREAVLTVDFETQEIAEQQDHSTIFADPTPPFVACTLACRSRIVTDEATYSSERRDYEEWPKTLAS